MSIVRVIKKDVLEFVQIIAKTSIKLDKDSTDKKFSGITFRHFTEFPDYDTAFNVDLFWVLDRYDRG